jgi:hypothetical protein
MLEQHEHVGQCSFTAGPLDLLLEGEGLVVRHEARAQAPNRRLAAVVHTTYCARSSI